MKIISFGAIALTSVLCSCASTPSDRTPASIQKSIIVIAHRGASGDLPEHTLEAFERAILQGADFIEPDLVMTKDGILIVRHENNIGDTTDVEKKFPLRKKTKEIDGETVTGWFTEDFTLAEIKTLKAKQRLSFRDQSQNGKYFVPTFHEVLEFVRLQEKRLGRRLGPYPEIKHSTYFASVGLPLEGSLLQLLNMYGYKSESDPVYIQSFEISNLKNLRSKTSLKLVQLIGDLEALPSDVMERKRGPTYGEMLSDNGLRDISSYASGIGPNKAILFADGDRIMRQAKAVGLQVHPWTLRNEPHYIDSRFAGSVHDEYQALFLLGVDGIFSDFPLTAIRERALFSADAKNRDLPLK